MASSHDVSPEAYAVFRSQAPGREMAAWLCRKWTGATLRELGPLFGIWGIDSASNLVRCAAKRHDESRGWMQKAAAIEKLLGLKTEDKG